ncbi:hypothetical protein [Marinobacter shengliensis]|uniref:hypothetical protein n=1 Tax=Marinobacter shengliensis TaxID=1389223 RepID=UPI00110971DC|nr:hypothetical protein [Marinobacter shengliensis]
MATGKLSKSDISRFWEGFTPQIQEVLSGAEERESWIYTRDELPELFASIEESLPQVVTIPPSPEQTEVFEGLISLLSSVPFRECIAALAFLERDSIEKDLGSNQVGAGTACFMIACRICIARKGDVSAARVVRDRVRYMVKVGFQLSSLVRSAEEVSQYA